MKKIILICIMTMFAVSLFAQQQKADSLINVLETQQLTRKEQLLLHENIYKIYQYNNIAGMLKYAKEGLQLAQTENDKMLIADFYNYAGWAYYINGSIDTAIVYYEKGLDLAIEPGYKKCEAILYRNLGYLFMTHEEYGVDKNTVFEYFLKTLQIAEDIDDKDILTGILVDISAFHYHLLSVSQCEQESYYIQRAMKVAETSNDNDIKARLYLYLGKIEKDVDMGINYSLKGLDFARSTGNKYCEIRLLQALGYIYCLDKKEYDKAEKYGAECLRIAEEFGEKSSLVAAWTVLSFVYLYQKRYDECKISVLKAWEADTLNVALATLTNLAAAYLYSGQLDEAHDFFVKYVHRLETNMADKFQKNIAETQTKYETEKKEIRISELEKRHKLYTWIFAISGVAVLLIIGLLYFRQRLNKQKVKQLEQEKQLVATQAILDGETAERSRLARDLHDGLGGMLSVVKLNLKDMQHYAVIDGPDVARFDKALGMLDQSIDELRRVAHHIMPEALMRYGLKVSLEDFCHAVPGAHFEYLGENPRLDSRLEVLIYRCAYELINNAVKHAKASVINVQLMIDSGVISLTVHDNGVGFDVQSKGNGTGLENIRTRIAAYNGKMTIHSSPEEGTEISIEIGPS